MRKPITKADLKALGLYNKFKVTRTDGQHCEGGEHDGCEYFVIDMTHDEFAWVEEQCK